MNKRKQQCDALLLALVGENLKEQWWKTPNKAFNLSTPEEIFENAPDTVFEYLMRMAEGEW